MNEDQHVKKTIDNLFYNLIKNQKKRKKIEPFLFGFSIMITGWIVGYYFGFEVEMAFFAGYLFWPLSEKFTNFIMIHLIPISQIEIEIKLDSHKFKEKNNND
jgi:hypothetical protein